MKSFQDYPGTSHHKNLLQAIVAHYSNDPRILSIIVFGSLGRGNWDPYSDLDLDVIIADHVSINVIHELEHLSNYFTNIGEHAALIVPDGEDAGDIVFSSLMGLSIRYHPLRSTSPNIVDSMLVLSGKLDEATIRAAGLANRQIKDTPLSRILDMCVRYVVEADRALQRRQIWLAIEIEHLMRGLLMELFARTHGGVRPLHAFEKASTAALQSLLGSTLSQFDLPSVQNALVKFMDILEHDLGEFATDKLQLTEAHLQILNQVRKRQANISSIHSDSM